MRRFHLAAGWIASPDDSNRAPNADRKTGIPCDFAIGRWRHLIENLFCDLKQLRGIATRYDKTARSFAAMINLTAAVMTLK
jgi:transposase